MLIVKRSSIKLFCNVGRARILKHRTSMVDLPVRGHFCAMFDRWQRDENKRKR